VRFVEKPPFEKARQYVQSGRFYWNSGMFCFAASTMIGEMSRHCPDILAAARECLSRSRANGDQLELEGESFARVPDNSIDYAVMEKSSLVSVVPCDIGWSDIGSWTAIGALTEADRDGNRVEGESVLHDVRDSYIRSEHRMVGAVGLSNVVIVDTPDALLVADASRAQDVKQIYARLKELGHEAHKLHRTVHRPWGTYTVLEEGPGFKIKRISVKPGASLSLQMHQQRSEHWIVVGGTAHVVNGEREFSVATNESTFIPPRNKHRLSNPHNSDLVIIEVQSGPYLGEDDIVRFDDVYGRVPVATG
jgi:mannose-1-phosphate guanylyltransferase